MKGQRLVGAGEGTIERLWYPVSTNHPAIASFYVDLGLYDHASLLIEFGAIAAGLDADLTVTASDDASGSNTANLATINYRLKKATAVWGAMTSVTDSKIDIVAGGEIVPSTDDNICLLIEVDAADILALSTTYNYRHLKVGISDGGAYAYVSSAVAILRRGRYTDHQPVAAV